MSKWPSDHDAEVCICCVDAKKSWGTVCDDLESEIAEAHFKLSALQAGLAEAKAALDDARNTRPAIKLVRTEKELFEARALLQ